MYRVLSYSLLLFLILLFAVPLSSSSYRIGDVVDTIVRTPQESKDALNHQMPQFGVPSSTMFYETPQRFSLAFQEGLRPLPWIDLQNKRNQPLKQVIVTFVYSKSGDGTIYSVSSETSYSDVQSGREGFRVLYQWKEEEQVDLAAGSMVMFLVVCIVSILVMVQTCTGTAFHAPHSSSDASATSTSYGDYSYPQQQPVHAGAIPKWD